MDWKRFLTRLWWRRNPRMWVYGTSLSCSWAVERGSERVSQEIISTLSLNALEIRAVRADTRFLPHFCRLFVEQYQECFPRTDYDRRDWIDYWFSQITRLEKRMKGTCWRITRRSSDRLSRSHLGGRRQRRKHRCRSRSLCIFGDRFIERLCFARSLISRSSENALLHLDRRTLPR